MTKDLYTAACELAKEMIKNQVLLGASLEAICDEKSYQAGHMGPGFWAQRGWPMTLNNGTVRHLSSREIGVKEVDELECYYVFRVEYLYQEIRLGLKQPMLWEK